MRHPERLRLGKRFVSYTQPANPSEPIEIRFQDGSAAQCDLLVGCDGVKSKVRAAMYTQLADAAQAAGRPDEEDALRSYGQAVFSGITLYRALAEIEKSNLSKSNALVMAHLILVSVSRMIDFTIKLSNEPRLALWKAQGMSRLSTASVWTRN